jgi:predicted membrane protein
MIIGTLIPFILLFIVVVMNRYLHDKVRNTLTVAASMLLLLQVFSMRWNIVIGGQLLSKSFRGLRSGYSPHLFDKEGVGVALIMFIVPFVLLFIFNRVLPIYSSGTDTHEHPEPVSTTVSTETEPLGGHT